MNIVGKLVFIILPSCSLQITHTSMNYLYENFGLTWQEIFYLDEFDHLIRTIY